MLKRWLPFVGRGCAKVLGSYTLSCMCALHRCLLHFSIFSFQLAEMREISFRTFSSASLTRWREKQYNCIMFFCCSFPRPPALNAIAFIALKVPWQWACVRARVRARVRESEKARERGRATHDQIWTSVYLIFRSCPCHDARSNRPKHQSRDRASAHHVIMPALMT